MGKYRKWRWYDIISLIVLFVILALMALMGYFLFDGRFSQVHGKDLKWVVVGYDDGTQESKAKSAELQQALSPYFQGLQTPTHPTPSPLPPPTPTPPPPEPQRMHGTTAWQLPVDKDGWVIPPISENVRQIYINPNGNDNTPGAGTHQQPFKNPARAISFAKRSPTTAQQFVFNFSGQFTLSAPLSDIPPGTKQYPTLLRTTPGDPTRASLTFSSSVPAVQVTNTHDLMIYNLIFSSPDRLQKQNRADSDGLYVYNADHFWVEGCAISFFTNNLITQSAENKTSKDIIIRRNVNTWNFAAPKNPVKHAEGYYAHRIERLLHEENFYVHNGWNPQTGSYATQFNQGVYQTGENDAVQNIGNIFLQASAHAMQARSGGVMTDNVAVNCPIGFSWGLVNGGGPQHRGGVIGQVARNVVIGGGKIGSEPRSMGFQFGNIQSATITDNLVANQKEKNPYKVGYAFSFEHGEGVFQKDQVGLHNITFGNNHTADWSPSMYVEPGYAQNKKGEWSIGNFTITASTIPNPILNNAAAVITMQQQPALTNTNTPTPTLPNDNDLEKRMMAQQPLSWDKTMTGAELSKRLRS